MNNFGKIAEKIGILVQGGIVNIDRFILSGESSQERRNRQKLLDNVREAWIEGVLKSSLYQQVPIILSLEERSQAVKRPWSLELKNHDQPSKLLPESTSIMEQFDQLRTGGTLLILGDPGSGKTLTLLELARDLITRAEKESDQPIPVVLNLSSWPAQKPLSVWMVEEINAEYKVPKKVGEEWVKGQKLTLLLDGLDEIQDLSARNKCVKALNTFQQKQETAIVVCCRVKDYEKLDNRLEGKNALVIQPLSSEQIRTYFDQLQVDLTGLKALLERDIALQELAQSPLMLNIMVLAYQGVEIEEGFEMVTTKERMKKIFDDYINKMFTCSREFAYVDNLPSQEKKVYSRQQTTRWLVWLARQMIERSQTVFLIEKLQPDWLASGNLKVLYKILVALISGLIIVLVFGSLGGLTFGLIVGLILVLIAVSTKLFEEINTVEAVKWSWKGPLNNMLYWSRFAVSIGLISLVIFALGNGLNGEAIIEMILMLCIVLFIGALIGWPISSEIENKNQPNQGIRVSGRNAIIFGCIFGEIGMLIFRLTGGRLVGLIFGLIFGLIGGFANGGLAFLQHFTLRFLLYRNNCMPWKLVPFLQFCTERLFLYRVGGGYIFVHRLLMEHFAQMEE
jgi:eukaryotic-like serine/threonine-protein kinase